MKNAGLSTQRIGLVGRRLVAPTLVAMSAAACSFSSDSTTEAVGSTVDQGAVRIDATPPTTPGTTVSDFTVTHGVASYTVPLVLPAGTAGMAPKLALSYSSSSGSGIMSSGWSVSGLSAVTRCGATFAQDGFAGGVHYDSDDKFCVDGSRLMKIALTQEATDKGAVAEYRTEVETFARVLAYGTEVNPSKWTLETHTGLTSTYENPYPAAPTPNHRAWQVTSVKDRSGNTMTMSYTGNSEEMLLQKIDYSTNSKVANSAATQRVEFVYEARLDTMTGYLAGQKLSSTKRLKTIRGMATVAGALTATREYRLGYVSDSGGPDRLGQVQECGADANGGLCYAPLKFDYHGVNTTYGNSVWGTARNPDSIVGDFNGDGRSDIVELKDRAGGGKTLWVSLAKRTGDGFDAAVDWGSTDLRTSGVFKVADLNADGRADLLAIQADGVAKAWLTAKYGLSFKSDGDTDGKGKVWGTRLLTSGDAADGKSTMLVDVDNDGVLDALSVTGKVRGPVKVVGSIPLTGIVGMSTPAADTLRVTVAGGATSDLKFPGHTVRLPSANAFSWPWIPGGPPLVAYTGTTFKFISVNHIGLVAGSPSQEWWFYGSGGDGVYDEYETSSSFWVDGPNVNGIYFDGMNGTTMQTFGANAAGNLSVAGLRSPGVAYAEDLISDTGSESYGIYLAKGLLVDGKPAGFGPNTRLATHNAAADTLKLGDFDGDGRPDVLAVGTGGAGTHTLWRNRIGQPAAAGASFVAETWTMTSQKVTQAATVEPKNYQVSDMNGDGADDLVYVAPSKKAGTNGWFEVLWSDGKSTLKSAATFESANLLEGAASTPNVYRIMDWDGDRRPDVVQIRTSQLQSTIHPYPRTATGFSEGTDVVTTAPATTVRVNTREKTPSGYPLATTLDYRFYAEGQLLGPQRVCREWGYDQTTMVVGCGTSTTVTYRSGGFWTVSSKGVRGQCATGDTSDPCYGYEWCTGIGESLEWVECTQGGGSQLGDFNGDGVADILILNPTGNESRVYTGANGKGNRRHLLARTTDGLGAVREIDYGRTGDAWTPATWELPFPQAYALTSAEVVTQVRESTTLTTTQGAPVWRTTFIGYSAPKVDQRGRGFLGFQAQTQSEFQSDARGLYTATTYRQDFPFIGTPYQVTKSIKGPWDPTTILLSKTVDSLATLTSSGGRPFAYTSSTETTGMDLDGVSYLPKTTRTNTYDAWGNLKTSTSKTYVWQTNAYVADGYEKTLTNTLDPPNKAAWMFDRVTRATTTVKSPSATSTRVTSFQYNTDGSLWKERLEPDSPTTTLYLETEYAYDSFGNKKSSKVTGNTKGDTETLVSESRTSSAAFDAQGRFVTSATNALSHVSNTSYDETYGAVKSKTDANGLVSTFSVDAMGRTIGQTNPDGSGFSVVFGACPSDPDCPANGKTFAKTTQKTGAVGTVYQDGLGREVRRASKSFDGTLAFVDTIYNALGRKEKVSRPYKKGATPVYTKTDYDAIARATTVTAPNGSIATNRYKGLTVELTDLIGKKTTKVSNSQGQLVTVTDAASKSTTYTYDGFGNVLTVTDPISSTNRSIYDARGRRTSQVDPDLGTVNHEYNSFGELIREDTPKLRTAATKRRFSYDALGRMTKRVEPEGTTTWTFDTAAKGASTTDKCKGAPVAASLGTNNPQTTFAYDSLCRVQTETRTKGSAGSLGAITTSYTATGQLAKQTYPDGFVIENVYGPYGHLTSVRNGTTTSEVFWTMLGADAEGNVTKEQVGNGLYTYRKFDPNFGRLSEIYTQASSSETLSSPVHRMTFLFDAVGNLKERWRAAGNLKDTFTYDDLHRLKTAGTSNVSVTSNVYDYDASGNLSQKTGVGTYSYEPPTGQAKLPHAVRSTTNGSTVTSYNYDEDGNLLNSKIGSTVQRELTWTSFDAPATVRNALTGAAMSFMYDASHERIQRVEGTNTTSYWLSARYERSATAGSAAVDHRHYVHAGPLLVGQYTRTVNGATTTNQVQYFHHDHLGSIVASTNAAQTVDNVSFDPHGRRRNLDGTNVTVFSAKWRPGYTGHEMLDSVGLVHMNARLYDPLLGRFVSGDPTVQYPDSTQGFNRYTYSDNNPTSYYDPSGYGFWKRLFRIFAAVAFVVLMIVSSGAIAALTASLGNGFWAGVLAHAAFGALAGGLLGFALTGTLKGAAMGALQGGLMGAVGSLAPSGPMNYLLHGVVGGAMAELQGGSFKTGFVSAAVAAWAGAKLESTLAKYSEVVSENTARVIEFVGTVVVGGVASTIQGGSFKNGAISAAYGYLFNRGLHAGPVKEWLRSANEWLSTKWDQAMYRLGVRVPPPVSAFDLEVAQQTNDFARLRRNMLRPPAEPEIGGLQPLPEPSCIPIEGSAKMIGGKPRMSFDCTARLPLGVGGGTYSDTPYGVPGEWNSLESVPMPATPSSATFRFRAIGDLGIPKESQPQQGFKWPPDRPKMEM